MWQRHCQRWGGGSKEEMVTVANVSSIAMVIPLPTVILVILNIVSTFMDNINKTHWTLIV